MSHFDDEAAVERLDDVRFSARVTSRWNIGDNPNGGYLLAIALAALEQLGPHPDPMAVTAHYLRPGTGDADAEVHTELIRSGRTVTTTRARLLQHGTARLEVLAAHGDLTTVHPGAPSLTIAPPDIPPPDRCPPRSAAEQGVALALADRIETRIHHPDPVAGAGSAEVSGWIRFVDDRPADTRAVVLFADAFPPSIFGLLGRIGWVPTVELTVQVRRRPAPGWLLGQFRTEDLHDHRMVEDGRLWDSTGELVAQARQTGLLLTT